MFTQLCVWIVVAQLIRYTLPWLYRNFLGPYFFGDNLNLKQYGEWAVVTGGSDGIGKAFVGELAKRGLNVCLISNVPHDLERVAQDIVKKYRVKALTINIDFTKGTSVYNVINQKIKDLDVGILINNVGIGYPGPKKFHQLAVHDNFLWDILSCNLIPVTFMTKLVINGMLQKKKGLIINISSLDATFPVPVCLYSSCKSYMNKFAEDFNIEYQGKGVSMQSINPGPVKTNVWCVDSGPWMKPTAEVYVASAIRSIGMGHNAIGYFPHTLLQLVVRAAHFVCPFIYNKLIWLNHKMTKYP